MYGICHNFSSNLQILSSETMLINLDPRKKGYILIMFRFHRLYFIKVYKYCGNIDVICLTHTYLQYSLFNVYDIMGFIFHFTKKKDKENELKLNACIAILD